MEELRIAPKDTATAAAAALSTDCEQCGGYRVIVDGVVRCGTCGWPAGVAAPRRAQAVPPSVVELLTKRIAVLEQENAELRKVRSPAPVPPAATVTPAPESSTAARDPAAQERQAVPPLLPPRHQKRG